MKTEERNKVDFFIPLELENNLIPINKGIKSEDPDSDLPERLMVKGLASSSDRDLDKHTLNPDKFIIDHFLASGFINYNHLSDIDPEALIGEPIQGKVKDNLFFIEGELYRWSNLAKKVYRVAKSLVSNNSTRKLGFSVEGLAFENDVKSSNITSLLVTGLAIAPVPKNATTYLEIKKGISIEAIKRRERDYEVVSFEDLGDKKREYILDFISEKNERILVDKSFNIEIRKAVQNLEKEKDLEKEKLEALQVIHKSLKDKNLSSIQLKAIKKKLEENF